MNDTEHLNSLRSEVRSWLAANAPANWREECSSLHSHEAFFHAQRAWFLKLVEAGYGIPHWP